MVYGLNLKDNLEGSQKFFDGADVMMKAYFVWRRFVSNILFLPFILRHKQEELRNQ